MSTKFRIAVGCVCISKAGTGQNGAALDCGLEALLSKGQTFELVKAVFLCSAAVW